MSINSKVTDESIAKAIADVRRTGLTNMYYTNNVIDLMRQFGNEEESEYLSQNKSEYIRLLILSSDY